MPDSSPFAPGSPQPAGGLPVSPVYRSMQSAFGESVELVVRSDSEWARVWLAAHPNRAAAPPPAPAIDFTTDLVLLVSPGMQPTGGVGVVIDTVVARADGGTDVMYTVSRPGAGCMATQQLTAPVDVVRVPRRSGVVRFVRHDRATPC